MPDSQPSIRNTGRQSEVDARWPKIALCVVHDEWWAVEREHDDKCPYPSCEGPVTVYVLENQLAGAVQAFEEILAALARPDSPRPDWFPAVAEAVRVAEGELARLKEAER